MHTRSTDNNRVNWNERWGSALDFVLQYQERILKRLTEIYIEIKGLNSDPKDTHLLNIVPGKVKQIDEKNSAIEEILKKISEIAEKKISQVSQAKNILEQSTKPIDINIIQEASLKESFEIIPSVPVEVKPAPQSFKKNIGLSHDAKSSDRSKSSFYLPKKTAEHPTDKIVKDPVSLKKNINKVRPSSNQTFPAKGIKDKIDLTKSDENDCKIEDLNQVLGSNDRSDCMSCSETVVEPYDPIKSGVSDSQKINRSSKRKIEIEENSTEEQDRQEESIPAAGLLNPTKFSPVSSDQIIDISSQNEDANLAEKLQQEEYQAIK